MSFYEKLEKIRPLESINGIKAGKEWNQTSYYIKGIILDREKYKEASAQKDAVKVHIVEMLHQLNYLSFEQTAMVIEKIFCKVFPDDKMQRANAKDIKIVKNKNNEVEFYYKDEKVSICWHPSIEETSKQILLPFNEYVRLKKMSEVESNSLSSNISSHTNFDFEDIVKNALEVNASDIHILYSEKYYNVSFRIYGRLILQRKYTMNSDKGLDFVKKIKIEAAPFTKGEFNADEHFAAQDAKIEYPNVGVDGVDVRLAFIPDGKLTNIAVVARILKRSKLEKSDFTQMGYYEDFAERVKMTSKRQNGLFISSGVTGSGKSTFISHVISNIDEERRVITVEDPIEYYIPNANVTQHQVYDPKDKEKRMGFKEYTKIAKRADPNVLNIGEMRNDPELIKSIMEMSEAGQLVLSTVHLTSAFSIYGSFKDVFHVSPHITVPLVLFSMNQVLVDRLCPHCRRKDTENRNLARLEAVKDDLPFQYMLSLESLLEDIQNNTAELFIKGDGCEKCENGYIGRLPIYEYFTPNVAFMEWLLEKGELPSRYSIEKKVCTDGIGVNKLDTFCRRLREGAIDASENVLFSIM